MALEIEKVQLGNLVRELSPDALKYFSNMALSKKWPNNENPRYGKFVRLGEVILLGSTVEYGDEDWLGQKQSVKHIDLIHHGYRTLSEDMTRRIEETLPEDAVYLKDTLPLIDAGQFYIELNNCLPFILNLRGGSYEFGRPDEATRQRTGAISQTILGSEFVVEVT
ncbi:MAG TPA: hypothetical protein VGF75_05665 [Candidatus Saccharimonadales bacterium]|jgi:hypothetical protein